MSAILVGWGHTLFGWHDEISLKDLIAQAAREAIADAGISAGEINAVWLGHFGAGMMPEAFVSSMVLGSAGYQGEVAGARIPKIFARFARSWRERFGDPWAMASATFPPINYVVGLGGLGRGLYGMATLLMALAGPSLRRDWAAYEGRLAGGSAA